NHLLVSLLGVLLANPPRADARPEPATSADVAQVRFRGGIRTDRLSRKQLKAWSRIVEIVMAEDRDGRPLHPRLRQLWDAVHSSSHTVYIEMPHRKGSYIAGRFAITRADPSGKMHEGILFLNPPVIDALSSASAVARPDGLIPFKGLGKNERYAELLGHELAHAVWAFADPNR